MIMIRVGSGCFMDTEVKENNMHKKQSPVLTLSFPRVINSISPGINFPCSLTRNITSQYEELGFS